MYDGGQLFRPFFLFFFFLFSKICRVCTTAVSFLDRFSLFLPGSKPTFVVLTQVTSKIAYYDDQFWDDDHLYRV